MKKLQSQLDAQGKAIDETRNDLATTRGDLSNTRTELTGSIARTHDELVLLQKKGERNYYEFDVSKSNSEMRLEHSPRLLATALSSINCLYLLRFERVDNLGAYSIPPETGLLIPSVSVNCRLFAHRRSFLTGLALTRRQ